MECHDEQRRAGFTEAIDGGKDFGASLGIEPAQRLVEEQDARPHRPECRERKPFLLATGECPRGTVPHRGQLEVRQRRLDASSDLFGGQSHRFETPRNFVFHGCGEELRGCILEEQAHTADLGGPVMKVAPGNAYRSRERAAGVARRKSGEDVAERALARARRTHDRERPARAQFERAAGEDRLGVLSGQAGGVGEGDVVCTNHG